MSNRKRNLSGLLAVAAVLTAGAAWCPGQETEKPVDPSPPVLKPVRWQYLDRKFQDVFIDGSGRAWFLIRPFPGNSGGKLPSMFLTCPELPDDYIEMPGKNRIIGFDSKDRFWEVGKFGLCCTDVRTGRFTQHKSAPGVDVSHWVNGQHKLIPTFGPTMLEHSTGRLYFVDSVGIHVLDGDRWSYELLLAPGKSWATRESGHCSVKLVEGPDGKVFIWQPGEYVNTLFVHDGTSWKRFPARDNPKLDRVVEIIPEADGWVRVSRSFGVPTRVKLYDSTTASKVPKATSRRTVKRFDHEFLSRAGDEMSLFGPALGQDKDGRVYFMTRRQEISDSYCRIAIFDARQAATAPTLKYQAFGLHRTLDSRAVAVDSLGGIWARLAVEDQPFLSRYADGKWTHCADPAPASSQKVEGTLGQYGYGATWVILPPSTGPGWLPDWEKDVRGVPSMANPALLHAMKNGCMVAAEQYSQRAFAFDGRSWSVYESTKALVEARYEWLKENMDNRGMTWRRWVFLGLDGAGLVWVSVGSKRGFSGAYNGRRWQDIPGPFEFNATGDRCLSKGFLWDTSTWPAKELVSTRSHNYSALPYSLRADGQGTLVPADRFGVASYDPGEPSGRPSHGSAAKGRGPASRPAATPVGEVRWLSKWTSGNPGAFHITAVFPDGSRSRPYRHPWVVNPQVVHQDANVYWTAAGDGLLRLQLQGHGDKARVVLDKLYPRIIPPGRVRWMAIGADGALWVATQFGKSGLYRIEIPPVTEGK